MAHIADGMDGGIGWGTLAASAAFTLMMAVSAGGTICWDDLPLVLFLVIPTMIFAFFLVMLAAIMLGLPTVWLLRRIDCASCEMIGMVGALAGLGIFLVPELADGAPYDKVLWVFGLAGMLGGGVTGAVWGAGQERKPAEHEFSPDHPNRIEDPRMLR